MIVHQLHLKETILNSLILHKSMMYQRFYNDANIIILSSGKIVVFWIAFTGRTKTTICRLPGSLRCGRG